MKAADTAFKGLLPLMKSILAAIWLALFCVTALAQVKCANGDTQWKGTGTWPDAKQWTKGVPNAATDACIANGKVTLLGFPKGKPKEGQTKDLRLLHAATIVVPNLPNDTTSLVINGMAIQNDGTISLVGGNSLLVLKNNNITLSGAGALTMGDASEVHLGMNLLNESTVQGAGKISKGTKLENKGSIKANIKDKTLEITVKDLTNSGTMQAVSGGKLELVSSGEVKNSGTIEAMSKSIVEASGKLTNDGNLIANGGTLSLKMQGTNNGKIAALNGGKVQFTLTGAFTNSGLGTIETEAKDSSLTINTTPKPYDVTNDGTILIRPNTAAKFDGAGKINNSGVVRVQTNGTLTGKALVNGNAVSEAKGSKVTFSDYLQTGGATLADGSFDSPRIDIQGGTLLGTGILQGETTMGGVLRPGDSDPGAISFIGGYTQTATGMLAERLGSNGYGVTDITGEASLSGTLDINLLPGFIPTLGQTFDIMNFLDSSGQFSTVKGRSIGHGEMFDVTYNSDNVTLQVVSASETPEPATLFLVGSGVLGFAGLLRKRLRA